MKFGQIALAAAVLAVSVNVYVKTAMAADVFGECGCVVPPSASQKIGRITLANGEVLRLGDAGYEQAAVNQSVVADTELLSGPNGEAKVVFSNGCSLDVGASASLTVSQPAGMNGGYCVRVAPSGEFAAASAASAAVGLTNAQVIGFIAGVGAFGVGIAVIAASD